MKIVTAAQMREIDRITIENRGVESTLLMEKAGSVVYDFIIKNTENIKDKKILIIAGAGNNGGDALVSARLLMEHDITVKVFIISLKGKLSKNNEINFEFLLKTGLKPEFLNDEKDLNLLNKELKDSDIIVDGIFGTGLDKPVKGFYSKLIELINMSGKKVVSIDIPSGVSSDTGDILGAAVKADYTVTFGLPKWGHFLSDGLICRGILSVENIGFGKDLLENPDIKSNFIDAAFAQQLLPKRAPDAHKGSCGKVLVIGGSIGYTGAPILAAISALRAGAGLAGICVPEELNNIFETQSLEVITHPVKSKNGHFTLKSFEEIKNTAKNYDLIILGPGMGRSKEVIKLVGKIIKEINLPKVVDADALYALSVLKMHKSRAPMVLTPHPLEFSRIIRKDIKEINSKLIDYIKKASFLYDGVIVYKKYGTIIAEKEKIYINSSGNSALATAGSGDVLSGMIGAYAVQGLPLAKAAVLAVYIHGLCADEYVKENDVLSMLAGDIISLLPRVIKKLREK